MRKTFAILVVSLLHSGSTVTARDAMINPLLFGRSCGARLEKSWRCSRWSTRQERRTPRTGIMHRQ